MTLLHIELHESTSHNTITLSEQVEKVGAKISNVNHATATMTVCAETEEIAGAVRAILAQDRHLNVMEENRGVLAL